MLYISKTQSFQIQSKILREQRNNSLANLTKRMLHDEFYSPSLLTKRLSNSLKVFAFQKILNAQLVI